MNRSAEGDRGHQIGDGRGHADSYLICATPRTGSTLLCGLLESTGVAGHPESYFRRQDEQSWADRWGVKGSGDGTFGFDDYLEATMSAGRTANGVFAVRVMWGTLNEVVIKLGSIHSDVAGSDVGLLNRAFGITRFIHLGRDDVVGQAVSWVRAEQTGVWQEIDRSRPVEAGREPPDPQFDVDRIHDLVQTIDAHNDAWQKWFTSAGVRPHVVRYEDVVADPVGSDPWHSRFPGARRATRGRDPCTTQAVGRWAQPRWVDRYRTLRPSAGRPTTPRPAQP